MSPGLEKGKRGLAAAPEPASLAAMTVPGPRPLIGVPADVKPIEHAPFHAVGDKYLRAISEVSDAIPLVVPAFGDWFDRTELLGSLDGMLFTGSPSNVHPSLYDQPPSEKAEPYDRERDATTLPLIRDSLAQGVPILAICRGFQELNVALGGSLHPRVHEIAGRDDHRRPRHEDRDVQYGPRHEIRIRPGGPFEALAGAERMMVNSLHWQGLDRVSDRLEVEAVAPDGTIEAVSVRDAIGFALGVQWHPEYKAWESPFSTGIFQAFGAAARDRAAQRQAARVPQAPERESRRSA